jgi:hypothetical protein
MVVSVGGVSAVDVDVVAAAAVVVVIVEHV